MSQTVANWVRGMGIRWNSGTQVHIWAKETVICQVAPNNKNLEAILAIDQADIEFISSGNSVELQMIQRPGVLEESTIDLISPVEMQNVPRALSSQNGGYIMSAQGTDGKDVPQSTTYQVRVPLKTISGPVPIGSTGIARIRTGDQTLGRRVWRFVCKTFRFDL